MSDPQQPGQFGPPQGGPQQPFNPGQQPPPPYGQQPGTPPPFGQQPATPGTPPPFGQQPVAPGTPPPFGQQPGFPAQPGMVPPPVKKNKALPIIIGLVVILGIGVFVFKFWGTSAASADVGDCIKVNKATATDADVDKIDCTKPEAVFKVGKKLDSASADCPKEGDYVEYEQSSRKSSSSGGFSLCLTINTKEGECFADLTNSEKARKLACSDPAATFEVLQVVEGKNQPEDCTADGVDDGFIYPEPKMVICGKKK